MPNAFDELQEIIGYTFKNKDLLTLAMTHSSYANENNNKQRVSRDHTACNERLEFLGDAVLQIVSSDFLYRRYENIPEGDLSPMRAEIVRKEACYDYGMAIGINRCLLLGRGERQNGGDTKLANVANAFEALIAAVYLDGGGVDAMPLITRIVTPFLENKVKLMMMQPEVNTNYKQRLQEFFAANRHDSDVTPEYRVLSEEGPDNDKTFTVAVYMDNNEMGVGTGKRKKTAEQNAAREALRLFGIQG